MKRSARLFCILYIYIGLQNCFALDIHHDEVILLEAKEPSNSVANAQLSDLGNSRYKNILENETVILCTAGGNLYGLDATNGTLKWTVKTGNKLFSSSNAISKLSNEESDENTSGFKPSTIIFPSIGKTLVPSANIQMVLLIYLCWIRFPSE